MEKLSLYDLLSVLLPGALLTLFIEFIAMDYGLDLKSLKFNQYFILTIFLSSSIFLGSLINILTRVFFKFYRKIGLYTSVFKIYNKSKSLNQIQYYFDDMLKKINPKHLTTDTKHQRIENLWSEIYYELEATEKIKTPKAFQSFYFFFRNFFTLGIILFIPLIIQNLLFWFSIKYAVLFGINIIGIFISLFAGKWYRERMVERMFWTYYSLHKNNITNNNLK
jgi:hypothetical protein